MDMVILSLPFHRIGCDGWALISETGVDSRYCGSRLSDAGEGGLYP